MTDAPEDFLTAMVNLVRGRPEAVVEFHAEPTVYRWTFHAVPAEDAEVAIRLESEGALLWTGREPLVPLARAVARAFDGVKHELGEAGYAEQWGRPFPARETGVLRRTLRTLIGSPTGQRALGDP